MNVSLCRRLQVGVLMILGLAASATIAAEPPPARNKRLERDFGENDETTLTNAR